ncbi:MAG TPA: hypothetical protein VGR44_12105 [Methylomirabilota bacterium]|jgi:hypothetical protein|nr:hypothetical protein [Methylomirabilota bacterium]
MPDQARILSQLAGFVIRELPVRRFTTLPQSGPAIMIIPENPGRIGLNILSWTTSVGTVYVDTQPDVDTTKAPLGPGGSLAYPVPYAPIDAFWAFADGAHDLRIIEVVRRSRNDY